MNNQYRKKSSKTEKESLYKSDGEASEIEYSSDGSRSPEELIAAKEYLALREQDLDRLIASDKEIEQYVDALLSVPNLDDDTEYIAQKLNIERKDVYRIRRKLRRRIESGEL